MNRPTALNTLGLKEGVSEQDIKKAYRQLANKFHPDKNKGDKQSEDKFKEVTAAYEFLTKPNSQTSGPNHSDTHSQFEEMLRGFKAAGAGNFKTASRQGSRKVRQPQINPCDRVIQLQDGEISLQVDIEAILLRSPIEINLKVDACCSACLSNKTQWHVCQTCKQMGAHLTTVKYHGIGDLQTEATCNVCKGHGWVNSNHCKICKDKLVYLKDKLLKFKIPNDYKIGNKVKLDSAGREGWNCKASSLIINPRFDIPDYSTLSEKEQQALLQLLNKK